MKRKAARKLALDALVALIVLVAVSPFVVMLGTALKTPAESVAYPPKIMPARPTLMHFADVLDPAKFPFARYFANSFIVAFSTALIAVVVGSVGAYAFAKLPVPGKRFLESGTFVVYMFSGILLVVPLFRIIAALGLYGSRVAVVIACLVSTLPAALSMLGNYFRTIPDSLEEAAFMDGLSRLQSLWRIILPLSLPAIMSVFVYVFMIAWNDFLFASIFLSDPAKMTLPIGLRQFFSSQDYVWGRMMAASLLTGLPVVIMFAAVEKYITGGLTSGGVKN
ncbi:MAG: carbohydrate ABC transporter permease [Spirochaetales bacterium]|nr:carbohydrate ABC transporter permease [Spirochaetales bacterium]